MSYYSYDMSVKRSFATHLIPRIAPQLCCSHVNHFADCTADVRFVIVQSIAANNNVSPS